MQAGKEEQEQQATKDFQKIEWYFEELCSTRTTRNEQILDKCEELFVGAIMQKRVARQ